MTQVGFWRQTQPTNQRVSLGGFGVLNNVWYVAPQGYAPTLGNTKISTFPSFAALKPNLRSRDLVYLVGVLREQFVAPDGVFDVTVIGAANQPRQSTSGGTPTGGGACWLAPTSPVATTPLLELTRQGWAFENIEFTPVNASAAVRLTRSATVDLIDAGHARFTNCYFAGNGGTTQIGIEDNGGCRSVVVENCRFEGLANTAILSLNTAAAIPLAWLIQDNIFQQNTNDIKMSLSYALIQRNQFMTAGSGATNKVISDIFISGQGGNNHIFLNQFSNTAAQIQISNGYSGASTDTWTNYSNNQAALVVGNPGA